jgi:hypothetical protein
MRGEINHRCELRGLGEEWRSLMEDWGKNEEVWAKLGGNLDGEVPL